MKNVLLVLVISLLSACTNLKSAKETNIAVSALLDELQIAINEIDEKTKGSSLPPFQGATIKLSTAAGKNTDGNATLVLSGNASKATKNSNSITLELVPNTNKAIPMNRSTGHEIAEYVVAAVTAIDNNNFLKLKALNVEAGLEIKQSVGGGIEIELSGVEFGATHKGESTSTHTLNLTFAEAKKEK